MQLHASDGAVITPTNLRQIWDEHSDRLTLIARTMVDRGNAQDAEDAVQEAFISLATQSAMPDDPLAWLVRVTRNQLLQWRRSEVRRQRREHEQQAQTSCRVWLVHPQVAVDRRLDAFSVVAALAGLPEEQRQVIVMHIWGEMTFQQIAGVVDRSRSSVHRLYSAGLVQLKQRFDPTPVFPCVPPTGTLQ